MNHHTTSDEDLKRAFFIFDQNGDGSIDEQEFFAAMAYLGITKNFVAIDKDQINKGFEAYDVDGDGKISLPGYFFFKYIRFGGVTSSLCSLKILLYRIHRRMSTKWLQGR